jgi:hypothetical protein
LYYQPRPNSLSERRKRFNLSAARYRLNGDFILTFLPVLVLSLLLWRTPVLFPFRIFTSTLHEASHMIAGIFTGAQVGQIIISPISSSLAQIETTNSFQAIVVGSAGYLGSVLFGGLLLLLARRYSHRKIMIGVVIAFFLIFLLFARNPSGIFVIMVTIFAAAVAFKGHELVVTFSLYMLAFLSCFNSIMDLMYLLNISTNGGYNDPLLGNNTDALILQTYTHIPATVWALSWSIIGISLLVFFVLFTLFLSKKEVAAPAVPNIGFISPTVAPPFTAAVPTPASRDDDLINGLLARYNDSPKDMV